jgi:20S proteasome alpha/beta subunit
MHIGREAWSTTVFNSTGEAAGDGYVEQRRKRMTLIVGATEREGPVLAADKRRIETFAQNENELDDL